MSGQAEAQQGAVISGTVSSEAGVPLQLVTIAIPTLGLGAQTDDDGRYSLIVPGSRTAGQTVTIRARRAIPGGS